MKEYKVPVQSLIDHIKTAIDVDPWAKEMAEELLKEQEAVKPHISEAYRCTNGRMARRRAWCGACGLGIRIGSNKRDRSNFCERCGRPVKWD